VKQNLGNAFRLAVLWKFGGTYFDLDIISSNPLMQNMPDGSIQPLGRFIAKQEKETLNNAAMRFPMVIFDLISNIKNDLMLWEIMVEFVRGWDGWKWANNGKQIIN
jgi:lactosylceramide 4-alpha-galactosyltransferase